MAEPRSLRDPRALTAVAHPVRLGILELLAIEGEMSATELGDRLDETPANCSWHLRKLAEHDLIEEAPHAKGRRRPWRIRQLGLSWGEGEDPDPAEQRAGQALSRMLLERWVDRFLAAGDREPAGPWREASTLSQHAAWLTLDELADLTARLREVAGRYDDRLSTGERPEGSRLVEVVAWAAPVEIDR